MTNYITTFLSTALVSLVVASAVPTDKQVDPTCGEATVTPEYTVTLCVQGNPTHTVGVATR